jgi:hypothetical protein
MPQGSFVGLLVLVGFAAAGHAAVAHDPSLHAQGATAKGAVDRRALDRPARDSLWACGASVMGPALGRPWLAPDGTVYFARKPVVDGSVSWASRFAATEQGEQRLLQGNGLPAHATGRFPVSQGSLAGRYDPNPNTIRERNVAYAIPRDPKPAPQPSCLPMGPIGVAVTGGMFFNALDAELRDAVANELFDACEGHPDPRGGYHYHHGSPCFPKAAPGEHGLVVGWALDGFAIHGPQGEAGRRLTNADLDECHGHSHALRQPDGSTRVAYHYHLTDQFPYTLGCFRGAVDPSLQRRGPPPGGPGRPPPGPPPRG